MSRVHLELMTHLTERRLSEEQSFGFFNPYTDMTRVLNPRMAPSHYTTEGGGHYSMRPDLSRISPYPIYGFAGAVLYVGPPVILAGANFAVIDAAPEEQQQGFTQMFTSALTGTFGIGSGLDL